MDNRHKGYVADNILVWGFSFRRNLADIEISDFASMLGMLNKTYLSVDISDVRIWKPDANGKFSVKSFYNALNERIDLMAGCNSFWDSSVPPTVLSFCWVARKHKILTIDKLRKRNHVIVNTCPMCLNDEESVHHLFFYCQFVCKVDILCLTGLK